MMAEDERVQTSASGDNDLTFCSVDYRLSKEIHLYIKCSPVPVLPKHRPVIVTRPERVSGELKVAHGSLEIS